MGNSFQDKIWKILVECKGLSISFEDLRDELDCSSKSLRHQLKIMEKKQTIQIWNCGNISINTIRSKMDDVEPPGSIKRLKLRIDNTKK